MAQAIQQRSHDLDAPPVSPLQTEFTPPFARRLYRNEGEDVSTSPVSPIMSRRTSQDSDRYSTVSGLASSFPSNPTNVDPAPAYVASFGAVQVVSEHQASKELPVSDSEDENGKNNKDDVHFSEPALALINAFLDQLLYSFLSKAGSTSLTALRPAVTDVLKHRLAREAISSADTELADLLAGGEEEEEVDAKHRTQEEKRKWDLELVWQRTRLRVMVYMRLGEMEDEDEQRYVQREDLFYASERRFTSSTGLVSWSAAIFLTSVLEYVAEQTLQVAGQAAYTRIRRQSRSHRRSMSSDVLRGDMIVEEYDVEKVALNSMLGRLWRTWRKSLRNNGTSATPTQTASPAMSRRGTESTVSAVGHRRNLSSPYDESIVDDSPPMSRDQQDDIPEAQYSEHILAANIPLPLANDTRDIDEIVVPGLARDPDAEGEQGTVSDEPYPDHVLAALVLLPISDERRDVDEIEVPGLARDPDVERDETSVASTSMEAMRRKSFAEYSYGRGLLTSEDITPSSSEQTQPANSSRQRSASSPPLNRTPSAKQELVPNLHADEDESSKGQHESEMHDDHAPEAAKAKEETDDTSAERGNLDSEPSAQTRKAEFPWMAAGAGVAVATATAGTAWASRTTEKASALPDEISDIETEVSNKDTQEDSRGLSNVEAEALPKSPSEKDIEELDKRKSLLDIKHMMVVNGPSGDSSALPSPQAEEYPTPATGPSGSCDPYDLTNRAQQEAVLEQDDDLDSVEAPENFSTRGVSDTQTPDPEAQQAREQSKRPADLVFSESASPSEYSPTKESSPPRTPRQFLDLTSESESAPEQLLPQDSKESQTADLSDSAVQRSLQVNSPTENELASRESAAPIHKKQSSDSTVVQEHPIVQRIASRKGSEPSSISGSEKALPLTSAAIKGPEDFDLFVQGGETLKYTLTPEHVRDDPVGSDVRYAKARDSPVELDATSSNREVPASTDNRTGRSATAEGQTSTLEKRRSQSRPSARNTVKHRKSGLMAREPRVLTQSTRDFADFIRSTGPDRDATVLPLLASASSTSLHSLRSAHINGASASRSSSPGPDRSRSVMDGADVPPVPPIPQPAKNSMQPRGATIVGNGSSELIDFIRSGPKEDGKPRISRSVAPFRTTMDSDQFDDLSARQSSERMPDQSVGTGSSHKSASQRTSANSRSALLNVSNGASSAVAQNGLSRQLSGGLAADSSYGASENNEPSRKRYRNKDPHAMDFDFDDEEDDLVAETTKSTRRDESLLEFLRNHEPISNGPPRPLIDPNSATARRIINNARMGINGTNGQARTMANTVGPRAGPPSSTPFAVSDQQTTSRSKREAKSAGSKSRSGASRSNTKDLADFIRHSAPPDDPDTAPAPSVGRGSKLTLKEEAKERKKTEKKKRGSIFSRGRNQRYLDMP